MPRSSRSKSHKQSKHSSKETAAAARDYSGSDEDVKMKERSSNDGKEDGVSVRISKDSSAAGERRKHGKDLSSSHGNGDVTEEYTTSSKRREEKSHGGSDRWNGGSSEEKGVVVNIENKELLKSKDFSKGVGESKSKSSRRHDAESANAVVTEKDESKSGSGNRGEKRKSEKESARKENSKENKESKDKDRGSDRGRKVHPDKLEPEASSKHVENQTSKRGKEITGM
ncbi:corepressor interacting with RBPJ 1-like [Cynara cardunculus var. scolymus]|uniref:corepressor interacting with RBPJ 1-like n=1 Tax=Cynara cardunculus var. scolymus TaxID=59895 RepID=UPI000D62A640|nr:corepressor interacting with RBPJ 1-like [Cynara cardunculus var. scolymus]